jgi:hypothetical protein
LLCALVLACSPSTTDVRAAEGPHSCLAPPDGSPERSEALRVVGQTLYAALHEGAPEQVLFDDAAVNALLTPNAATRARALRAGLSTRLQIEPVRFQVLGDASPDAICVQGTRIAEPGDVQFGNQDRAWVFERALISGEQPGGRKVAAWVEGTFVFTDAGFGAIDLSRVEAPRWEHSDLELATCDVRVSLSTPQDVVVATD